MAAEPNINGAGTLVLHEPNPAPAPVAPRHGITDAEINTTYRLADGLARSGFFKDARQATQAFAKLMFGRDLGLTSMQAMTGIHIVEGKPEMAANLMAGRVRSHPHYDYKIVKWTDEACELIFTRDGEPMEPPVEFTMKDAKRAELDQKHNYRRHPRSMLFARAMSMGTKLHCPDVFNGIPVYVEGEIEREDAPAAAASAPAAREPEAAARLDEVVVDTLRRGVEIAGWDPARLANELTRLGVVDTSDPDAALAMLTDDQATALSEKLQAAADQASAEQEAGAHA